jgi:hypothetical protein
MILSLLLVKFTGRPLVFLLRIVELIVVLRRRKPGQDHPFRDRWAVDARARCDSDISFGDKRVIDKAVDTGAVGMEKFQTGGRQSLILSPKIQIHTWVRLREQEVVYYLPQ